MAQPERDREALPGPFCTSCGATLEPDAGFCVICGSAIEREASLEEVGVQGEREIAPSYSRGMTVVEEADEYAGAALLDWVHEPGATILEEPEPTPARIRLEIEDIESGGSVMEFELAAEQSSFAIGRDGRVSNYVPDDPRSSRRHFSIRINPEGFVLRDLGSSNGTYVNGMRISDEVILQDGDRIEYGRSAARFVVVQEPDPWPTRDSA